MPYGTHRRWHSAWLERFPRSSRNLTVLEDLEQRVQPRVADITILMIRLTQGMGLLSDIHTCSDRAGLALLWGDCNLFDVLLRNREFAAWRFETGTPTFLAGTLPKRRVSAASAAACRPRITSAASDKASSDNSSVGNVARSTPTPPQRGRASAAVPTCAGNSPDVPRRRIRAMA